MDKKEANINSSRKIIKLFLASSKELEIDRKEFEIFINRENKELIKNDIFIELVIWEDFIDCMSTTRLQDEYNKAAINSDIFVSLFWRKVGNFTKEEFFKVLDNLKTKMKPLVFTYFNTTPTNPNEIEQSLLDFKKEIERLGHHPTDYTGIGDLKYRFKMQLQKILVNYQKKVEVKEVNIDTKENLEVSHNNKPKVIDWRVTGDCNGCCFYCYGPTNDFSKHPSSDTIIRICEKILDTDIKVVRFSGGEPTLLNNFGVILEKLRQRGKRIILSTNGTKYFEYESIIDANIEKLNLPLDSFNAEEQTLCGHTKESFENVINILKKFKEQKAPYHIKIGTVLTKRNATIENLISIYNILANYDIDSWKIYQYVPEGEKADLDFCINPAKFNDLEKQLLAYTKGEENFEIRFSSLDSRSHAYFIIQPCGEVMIPCEDTNDFFKEREIGNILIDDIQTLISRWSRFVRMNNHNSNISLLNKQSKISEIEKLVLSVLNQNPIITNKKLCEIIKTHNSEPFYDNKVIEKTVQNLFERKVIKYTVPIINFQALNYTSWRFQIISKEAIGEDIVNSIKSIENVAWLVSLKYDNGIIGAIFSKTPLECQQTLSIIEKNFQHYNAEVKVSAVTTEYWPYQGFLFSNDLLSDNTFENSKIEQINGNITIEDNEKKILRSLGLLQSTSLNYLAKNTGLTIEVIEENIQKLKEKKVFLKFQTICDNNKLGGKWFTVVMALKRYDSIYYEFIDYLSSFKEITHINSMIGDWDVSFEVRASNKSEVEEILNECEQTQFSGIRKQHHIYEIEKEHKLIFLIKPILDSL